MKWRILSVFWVSNSLISAGFHNLAEIEIQSKLNCPFFCTYVTLSISQLALNLSTSVR